MGGYVGGGTGRIAAGRGYGVAPLGGQDPRLPHSLDPLKPLCCQDLGLVCSVS